MNAFFLKHVRLAIVGICSIAILLLFSACSSLGTGTGSSSIVGKIQSVNAANHSVIINVNGQNITVSNLTDSQIASLQTQLGKTYSFQVEATQNTTNSYTLTNNTDPIENDNATPVVNVTETPDDGVNGTETPNNGVNNETGSLSFTGKVQQANSTALVVTMPSGQALSMEVVNGQSDLSDFAGSLPPVNTPVKVKSNANPDGSFTLSKLGITDANDAQDPTKLNKLEVEGVTTQAVGSDNIVHVKVGSKTFAFALTPTSELKDFANAQAIQSKSTVKLEVLFNGGTGSILKIENANG